MYHVIGYVVCAIVCFGLGCWYMYETKKQWMQKASELSKEAMDYRRYYEEVRKKYKELSEELRKE